MIPTVTIAYNEYQELLKYRAIALKENLKDVYIDPQGVMKVYVKSGNHVYQTEGFGRLFIDKVDTTLIKRILVELQ